MPRTGWSGSYHAVRKKNAGKMPVLPVYPLNGFDAVDDEDVASGAEQADGAGHGEGPEESAGAFNDDTDQSRRDHSCDVAAEILKAGPAAGGLRSGEDLRHGPEICGAEAERSTAQK